MVKRLLFALAFLASSLALPAQGTTDKPQVLASRGNSLLSLGLSPGLTIPLGSHQDLYALGVGGGLKLDMRLPAEPSAWLGGRFEYAYLPSQDPNTVLSVYALSLEAGWRFGLAPRLWLGPFIGGGGFGVGINGSSGMNWSGMALGGLRLGLDLGSSLALGLEAGYGYYGGLLGQVRTGLSLSYRVPAAASSQIRKELGPGWAPVEGPGRGLGIVGISASPVFPVFSKQYDEKPVARILLRNFEGVPADSIRLSAKVQGFMDGARDCTVPLRIGPGQDGEAEVHAIFDDHLLAVAETTKASLTLSLEYSQYGKLSKADYSLSLEILFRNAMTWDDDRHLAAFISGRDPAASGFARAVLVYARDSRDPALSQDFQTAAALYESLRLYGLAYVKDPVSALSKKDKLAVDSLQFPQQTLQFKTGDCDDLTILYCSLLEAVGVETAFITVPGHVLPAFSLGLGPDEAMRIYGNARTIIGAGGKAWVPLELTDSTLSFIAAWNEGAKEYSSAGTEGKLYPTRLAWQSFPPVVMSGLATAPEAPPAKRIAAALAAARAGLEERELPPRVAELTALIAATDKVARAQNSLGLLYARFGKYDKAVESFKKALAREGDYRPAQVNLGNCYLLQKRYKDAAATFAAVLAKTPKDSSALLGSALAYDFLGDRAGAGKALESLKAVSPVDAERLAYIGKSDPGARAASASALAPVNWEE